MRCGCEILYYHDTEQFRIAVQGGFAARERLQK